MSATTVVLAANTSRYPDGGGFMWIYLNWALGLRSLGCRVVWLEEVHGHDDVERNVGALRSRLERYGFGDDAIALCGALGDAVDHAAADGCLTLDDVADADLLLNLAYDLRTEVVGRFR